MNVVSAVSCWENSAAQVIKRTASTNPNMFALKVKGPTCTAGGWHALLAASTPGMLREIGQRQDATCIQPSQHTIAEQDTPVGRSGSIVVSQDAQNL